MWRHRPVLLARRSIAISPVVRLWSRSSHGARPRAPPNASRPRGSGGAPEDGVVRAVRALVEMGPYFLVLARDRGRSELGEFERGVAAPLRLLFERGQADGGIRTDVPANG